MVIAKTRPNEVSVCEFYRCWTPVWNELASAYAYQNCDVCFVGIVADFGEKGDITGQYKDGHKWEPNLDLFEGNGLTTNSMAAPNCVAVCTYISWDDSYHPAPDISSGTADCTVFMQFVPTTMYKRMTSNGYVISYNPRLSVTVPTVQFTGFIQYPNYEYGGPMEGQWFVRCGIYDGTQCSRMKELPIAEAFKRNDIWTRPVENDETLLPNLDMWINTDDLTTSEYIGLMTMNIELIQGEGCQIDWVGTDWWELLVTYAWLPSVSAIYLPTETATALFALTTYGKARNETFAVSVKNYLNSAWYQMWRYRENELPKTSTTLGEDDDDSLD